MIVILTEKPDAADNFFSAIQGEDTSLVKKGSGYYLGKDITIISAYGHLCSLALPQEHKEEWKFWKIEALPIFPEEHRVVVSDDDYKKERFSLIKSTLLKSKEIVVATDGDIEGEYIAWLILKAIQKEKDITTIRKTRVWLQNLSEKEIQRTYKNRDSLEKYNNVAMAGNARAETNYEDGLTWTRFFTVKTQSKNVINMGTVKCPTLAIVVKRYLENTKHKIKVTWSPVVIITDDKGKKVSLHKDIFYETKEAAEKNTFSEKTIAVKNKEVKITLDAPPSLFSTTQFTLLAEKQLKIPGEKSSKILQDLYEKHTLVSYPRTDSSHLKESQIGETVAMLQDVFIYLSTIVDIKKRNIDTYEIEKSNNFNDSKVSGHHAIIPISCEKEKIERLTEEEKRVYDMICVHTASAFMPPRKKETTLLFFSDDYFLSIIKTLEKGYRELLPLKEEVSIFINKDTYEVEKNEIREIRTKPKPLFTYATLIAAMANAGKDIQEDALRLAIKGCGIGSEATRETIISALLKVGQLQIEKGKIIPTPLGLELVEKLSSYDFFDVEKAAAFQLKMKQVEQGEYSSEKLKEEIRQNIQEQLKKLKQENIQFENIEKRSAGRKTVGNCPNCKKEVFLNEKKTAYYCVNAIPPKDGSTALCDFLMFSVLTQKLLTFDEVTQLYNGDNVSVKGLISKKKKKFGAVVKFLNENGKRKYEFVKFLKKTSKTKIK